MAKIIQNLKLGIDEILEEKLQWMVPEYSEFRILRKSVDARQRHSPHFIMTLEVAEKGERLKHLHFQLERLKNFTGTRPLIVGTGPAGLFTALRLLERGIPSIIFERGSKSAERIKGINKYWRYGELDKRNNVCFGEGGAGLYSDGKLITRIKSEHIPYVMRRLVDFGAPAEIEYLSNPHVGSDKIRRVIPALREHLLKGGCEIHYDTQVTELIAEKQCIVGVKTEYGKTFRSDFIVLATGHSAEDMLYHLEKIGVFLEGKSFAMGLRIEHPQQLINKIQYRNYANHPKLGAANYKLATTDSKTQIGVYSFCMCPGGYILSSGTDSNGVVSNGMSNFNRNSPFANAAMVVSIAHESLENSKEAFAGLKFRRQLETKAFDAVQKLNGKQALPAQNLMDFMNGTNTAELKKHSCPSGAVSIRLDQLLPKMMTDNLRQGLEKFEKNMGGFMSLESQLFGIESRTSCPIRVTRNPETLESVSHSGLFPAGEGAGYAGGITSAACDGIRIADKIYDLTSSQAKTKD